jgi:hypothetical protein
MEAFNLVFEKYLAEIQREKSLIFPPYHRVLAWFAIGDFHHII